MDIELARTFIEIVRCGSFIAAAERLHVTQTAITARVQNLESQLNCKMFVRNRAGARLTADGEAFVGYANQLVQTWEAAQRDLPLPQGYRKLLHVGGELSLCNPLMLHWMRRLREHFPDHALSAEIGAAPQLLERLELGRLDAVLENSWVVQSRLAELGRSGELREAGCREPDVPIYLAFSPARADSSRYVELFEQGLQRYRADGRLQVLLGKYGVRER